MVNYRRNKLQSSDAIYFITMNTCKRHHWFVGDEPCINIVKTMKYLSKKHQIEFPAWVILPEHIHWLICPFGEDYSQIVFSFKRRVTSQIKNIYKIKGSIALWQDRFWEHTIKDEKDMSHTMDYIHFNPVKHRYVDSPGKWKYSSYHEYLAKGFYADNLLMEDDNFIFGMEYDI